MKITVKNTVCEEFSGSAYGVFEWEFGFHSHEWSCFYGKQTDYQTNPLTLFGGAIANDTLATGSRMLLGGASGRTLIARRAAPLPTSTTIPQSPPSPAQPNGKRTVARAGQAWVGPMGEPLAAQNHMIVPAPAPIISRVVSTREVLPGKRRVGKDDGEERLPEVVPGHES